MKTSLKRIMRHVAFWLGAALIVLVLPVALLGMALVEFGNPDE